MQVVGSVGDFVAFARPLIGAEKIALLQHGQAPAELDEIVGRDVISAHERGFHRGLADFEHRRRSFTGFFQTLPKRPNKVNDIFVFSVHAPRCIENDDFIISGGASMRRTKMGGLNIIRGARPLAAFIFGDEREWRKVYQLKEALGLFRLNGKICGRPETIEARITEHENRSRLEPAA
jgi:hypothetical protein